MTVARVFPYLPSNLGLFTNTLFLECSSNVMFSPYVLREDFAWVADRDRKMWCHESEEISKVLEARGRMRWESIATTPSKQQEENVETTGRECGDNRRRMWRRQEENVETTGGECGDDRRRMWI
uniref:Uncharacterized protein n=1 Tax=Timema tahoe TaxID=61484 RepID=A0A7R9IBR9_9NEOP|nr:unnamed protein product [Timema tahoe]